MHIRKIHEITKIDTWFLHQIDDLVKLDTRLERKNLDSLDFDILKEAKEKGYPDAQIAFLLRLEDESWI